MERLPMLNGPPNRGEGLILALFPSNGRISQRDNSRRRFRVRERLNLFNQMMSHVPKFFPFSVAKHVEEFGQAHRRQIVCHIDHVTWVANHKRVLGQSYREEFE